jgi:asparagine synthase (glutamine-hydrolysing)
VGDAVRIDREALSSYLRFGWIPGDRSIYAGIRRLPPATVLTLEGTRAREVRYWNPDLSPLPNTSRSEVVEIVRHAMREAMTNKLVADVPIGVLLSGGLDSSAVVAMCSDVSSGPLRTFSVGFGSATNELPYARQVAARYRTEHVELTIDANLTDAVMEIGSYFDEPFADSSSVPTFLICREARKHVKVILSGDGGDELLGGYGSYLPMRSYSNIRGVRGVARRLDASGSMGSKTIERFYPMPGNRGARAYWEDQRAAFSAAEVHQLTHNSYAFGARASLVLPNDDPLTRAFEFDLNWYLPDDLLKKVDMASMACSLECRAPLLDHKFIEVCMRIPAIEKVRGRDTKTLMREALQPLLPAEVIWREKQGFGAPLIEWLSGPLAELAQDSLDSRARVRELLDETSLDGVIERSWRTLRSDWRAPLKLWTLLSLELWLKRQSVTA